MWLTRSQDMKRVYWLIPCLGVTAFAGYYRHWQKEQDFIREHSIQTDRDEYFHRDGQKDAEAAWTQGRRQILTWGLPAPQIYEYAEILQRDYGVERRAIAGCVVSDSLIKYAAAYNEVMGRHLNAVYGKHVFGLASAKADILYAERHPQIEK